MRLKDFLNEMDPLTGEDHRDDAVDTEVERDHTSPDGSYEEHMEEAAELIEKIEDLLGMHSEKQSNSSHKWKHAGEMVDVIAKLQEIVDMLSPDIEEGGELEPDEMHEGINHMGETTLASYSKWRAACKKVNPEVWFDGDQDICNAMVGPKPYVRGKTRGIGEWDGVEGVVYK